MQVFQVKKTDTSLLGVKLMQLRSTTTRINPIEFLVPATNTFIYLKRRYFAMQLRVKVSVGGNLAHGPALYPATNLAYTVIKQLSVHVNGVEGWLTTHFDGFESNRHAFQAIDSKSCGLYTL